MINAKLGIKNLRPAGNSQYCKTCKKNISCQRLKSIDLWKMHISSDKHKFTQPLYCTINGLPPKPVLKDYRLHCYKFGAISGFKYLPENNTINISFRNPVHLTNFIHHELHVINNHKVRISWNEGVKQESPLFKAQSQTIHDLQAIAGLSTSKVSSSAPDLLIPQIKNYENQAIISASFKPKQTFVPYEVLFDDLQAQEAIIKKLNCSLSITDGFHLLIQLLQKHQKEIITKQSLVIADLKQFLPTNVTVTLYGSQLTHLNIPTSDYNFHLTNYCQKDESAAEAIGRLEKKMHEFRLFGCIEVIVLRHATILKCIHRWTSCKCAVTIDNLAVVHSSQLIRYYFQIDNKVMALGLFLKMLFHVKGLFLVKGGEFSPFTLALLIVFYFQQAPFSFPSVENLQKTATSDTPFDQTQVDCHALANKSLEKLFLDFLNFYLNFDYIHYDINVFTGTSVLKTKFFDDPSSNYIPDSLISMQDPFMHEFSTIVCDGSSIGKLQIILNDALKNISSSKPIYDIFTLKEKPIARQSIKIYRFVPNRIFFNANSVQNWFYSVRSLLLIIFTKVFKALGSETPNSSIRCPEVSVDGAEMLHLTFNMYSQLFESRMQIIKQFWKKFKMDKHRMIDKDAEVSQEVIKRLLEKYPGLKPDYKVHISLVLKKAPVDCSIVVGVDSKNLISGTFFSLFRFKLPQWFAELQGESQASSANVSGNWHYYESEKKESTDDDDAIEILDEILQDDNFFECFEVESSSESSDTENIEQISNLSFSLLPLQCLKTESTQQNKSCDLIEEGKRDRSWEQKESESKRLKLNDFNQNVLQDYNKTVASTVLKPHIIYDEYFFIGEKYNAPTDKIQKSGDKQQNTTKKIQTSPFNNRNEKQMFNPPAPAVMQPAIDQTSNLFTLIPNQAFAQSTNPKDSSIAFSFGIKHEGIVPPLPIVEQLVMTDKSIPPAGFSPISTNPTIEAIKPKQSQKKHEVIARVQKVIETMSDVNKFKSGLIIRPTKLRSFTEKNLQISPLKRIPNIQFRLTAKLALGVKSYTAAILTILQTNGINTSINLGVKDNNKKNEKSVQTQTTEPVECANCSKKKPIEYATISTQVAYDDFGLLPTPKTDRLDIQPAQFFFNQHQQQQWVQPYFCPQRGPITYSPNEFWL